MVIFYEAELTWSEYCVTAGVVDRLSELKMQIQHTEAPKGMWMIFIYNDVKLDIKQLNMSERCRDRLQGQSERAIYNSAGNNRCGTWALKQCDQEQAIHECELWSMAMKHGYMNLRENVKR